MAQVVKNLQKIWVQPLGQEDPLEEEMATHTSVLAWRIPWTEEPGRLWTIGSLRVGHGKKASLFQEYLSGSDQNIGRNTDGKNHCTEVSDGIKNVLLETGEKAILIIKWQIWV